MEMKRSNAGGLIGGTLLIIFGLLSLAGSIFRSVDWGFLWPFIIIGIGVLFFAAMFAGGKQTSGFAIPGSIVGGIGLVLLYQNIANHWESMAYFWTFIIFFVGAGIYIMGWYGGDAGQKKSGKGVMKVGLILFVIFGAFFEMIFSSFNNILFPILLILLGAYIILSRTGLFGGKKDEEITESTSTES
ncbi:MAG TPA: hypothetical protein VLA72_00860 [Anaerolineales bacterium]|nr:hypothetical protein [Anaerolineales bacterium]